MTISLSKSGACSVTKASAFARSAVGGLRFGGGTKAVAAVRQSSACRMAEGRIDGVELTAVAVQQTAGTVLCLRPTALAKVRSSMPASSVVPLGYSS